MEETLNQMKLAVETDYAKHGFNVRTVNTDVQNSYITVQLPPETDMLQEFLGDMNYRFNTESKSSFTEDIQQIILFPQKKQQSSDIHTSTATTTTIRNPAAQSSGYFTLSILVVLFVLLVSPLVNTIGKVEYTDAKSVYESVYTFASNTIFSKFNQ